MAVWPKQIRAKIRASGMPISDYADKLEQQIDELVAEREDRDAQKHKEGWNAHANYLNDYYTKALEAAIELTGIECFIRGIIAAGDGTIRIDLIRHFLPEFGRYMTAAIAENKRATKYLAAEFKTTPYDTELLFDFDYQIRLLEAAIQLYSEDPREAGTAERRIRALIEEAPLTADVFKLKYTFRQQSAPIQAFTRDSTITRLCELAHPYFAANLKAPEIIDILKDYYQSKETLTEAERAEYDQLDTWDKGGDAARSLRESHDTRYNKLT